MNNYNSIRDLLKNFSGQDNVITVPKIYIKFTGDMTTAILLNQIVFYSDKTNRSDGFFYKKYDDWQAEICLSERQVRHSAKKLVNLGVIETRIMKANGNPTVHYKLNYDVLTDSILTLCQIPNHRNVSMEPCEKYVSSITENTNIDNVATKDPCRKQAFDEDGPEMFLAHHLNYCIRKNRPQFKQPNLQSWCKEFDYMLRIDGRDFNEIQTLITWAQSHHFWKGNILSPKKLRMQYDTLAIQMQETMHPAKKSTPINQKIPQPPQLNYGVDDE